MNQQVVPETTSLGWTFLTNHTHVLLLIRTNPAVRVRDIANQVGITERSVTRIIGELRAEGFIAVTKHGRENHYKVVDDLKLRHPLENRRTIGELLEVLSKGTPIGS